MNKQTIEDKLQTLRDQYLQYPERRKSLELQAKCLKLALKKIEEKGTDLVQTAEDLFGGKAQ